MGTHRPAQKNTLFLPQNKIIIEWTKRFSGVCSADKRRLFPGSQNEACPERSQGLNNWENVRLDLLHLKQRFEQLDNIQ